MKNVDPHDHCVACCVPLRVVNYDPNAKESGFSLINMTSDSTGDNERSWEQLDNDWSGKCHLHIPHMRVSNWNQRDQKLGVFGQKSEGSHPRLHCYFDK